MTLSQVRGWFFVAFAMLLSLLFPADAWAGCEKDTDCKGDRVCRAGECVDPESRKCEMDNDCPGDEVCRSGACRQPQATPPQAAPQAAPMPAAAPPPARWEMRGECRTDLECREGCIDRLCRERRSAPLMIAGIVLLPTGFAIIPVGVAVWATNKFKDGHVAEMIVPSVIGGTMMTTGIVFVSVGAPRVVVEPEEEWTGAGSITIEPFIGLASGGLRVQF
jgi:hypothetical protein